MSNLYGYNTSNAYKLDNEFNTIKRTQNDGLHVKQNKARAKDYARNRAAKNMKNFLRIALCFAVAFVIVNGYVKINEAYNEVSKLEKEYNDIIATNQDLQVKIDKAVDLEQLQTIASERLGMVSPERYQMFYIDMQQGDYAETYADNEKTKERVAMIGVAGTITGAMNIFK